MCDCITAVLHYQMLRSLSPHSNDRPIGAVWRQGIWLFPLVAWYFCACKS
jgi:hypothetical protein